MSVSASNLLKVSKFLSFVLRHKPDKIGLELDHEGWASIDKLIAKADRPLSRAVIEEVVATNDKKRFVISDDGRSIRAAQGHSMAVDLGLSALEPPEFLYHGTATRFLPNIQKIGLLPQSRQYVHLSSDEETAVKVGQRHGTPVVLQILALQLHENGHEFFLSENGVWLTRELSAEHLREITPRTKR